MHERTGYSTVQLRIRLIIWQSTATDVGSMFKYNTN